MSDDAIRFRFWGVRGSIASPGPQTARYGGNTPCVEVRAGGRLIIIDGGSGLRGLSDALLATGQPVDADIFLTHLHWDHIQGIPFFVPAFRPGNRLRIHGERKVGVGLRRHLEGQMRDPYFPVPLAIMASTITFHEIEPGEAVVLGPVRVLTAPMNHPNGCLGLRFEHEGRSFVFCTDTEHDHLTGLLDPRVVELARGADVLVYDAMYTDEEYRAGRTGWGHSTYEEALRIARAAGVRQLYFYHHDPSHDDAFLDARLAWARASCAADSFQVDMAREGIELKIR